jgi:pimeloyl-ACP methyl ester carboxylesterase
MPTSHSTVQTSRADIAVSQTAGTGLPVLLIHGNSSCKEVFGGLLNSEFGDKYRLIAFDLPGHGASGDAIAPEETYTLPGYAATAAELISALGIGKAVVYGWSLGGYVGLEMAPLFPGLVGLMISGAPPVSPTAESLQAAYRPNPQIGLLGKPEFTAEDTEAFTTATYGPAANDTLRQAAQRTDGRARALMFAGLFAGQFADQRRIIETSSFPVAVVDGADDRFVNTDYVSGLRYAKLWDEHCYVLRGVGHIPFLEAPDLFYPIFGRFLADMESRASTVQSGASKAAAA